MKKIFSSLLFLSLSFNLMAVHLSFEILNPRFMREGTSSINYNYLDYEIWIKADNNGTYLGAAQIICSANYSNFVITSPPKFILGPAFNQEPDASDYTYLVTPSWGSNNISIAIVVSSVYNSDPIVSGEFSPVTTSWQLLGTIHVRIANIGPLSGIQFKPSGMDGYQKYKTDIGPLYTAYYDSPNYYIGQDLSYVYLGRLYSSGSGWSQVNGTYNVLTNHWTSSLNTTVWDTSSSAATIDTALALAGKLRINAAARLKINANMALTCSDSTIINSVKGLWIASSASGTGSFIDNGNFAYNSGGTAQEERYLTGYRWHYVSSPMSNAQSGVFLNDYLRYYNEPAGYWSNYIVPTTIPLTPMRGYEVYVNASTKTDYFTGQFNTGSQSYTLTNSGVDIGIHHYGWNLLGNPFPSAQDFGSATTPVSGWTWPTGPFRTLYYLYLDPDSVTFQYATYIWSTGLYTNNGTQYIPSGQGYMIWEDPGTPSASVSANNQTRVHNGQPFWKSSDDTYSDLLRLTANGNGYNDDAVVYFLNDASSNFNGYYDAFKLMNGGVVPSVYALTSDKTDVAVDVLPYAGINTVVPLGFSCGTSGNFTLTASNISSFRTGIEIYLEDKQVPGNAWPDLRTNPVYRFAYTTGEDPNRFMLHFTNVYFGISDPTINAMQIYSYEDFVYVKNITGGNTQGDVFIYDLTGRKIFQDKLQNNLINKYRINMNEGYYLVNVITPDNTYHQKVYLK